MILLHPSYFPNNASLVALMRGEVVWEVCDNFQKQTYRNRCHIATDQGLQKMGIPVLHRKEGERRQKSAEVLVDQSSRWAALHWKSLQAAYRSSPYFEFYEDELAPFFEQPVDGLMDLCLQSTKLLCELMDLPFPTEKTTAYSAAFEGDDLRFLVNAKKGLEFSPPSYPQVFDDRHGFVPNCSGLDLLFNEGPNARGYLSSCPWPTSNSARMG